MRRKILLSGFVPICFVAAATLFFRGGGEPEFRSAAAAAADPTKVRSPGPEDGDSLPGERPGQEENAASGEPDFFIFAAPENQGTVSSRSGRLWLSVTDLSTRAGPVNLDIKRRLNTRAGRHGLLGAGWKLDWESRLDRVGTAVLIDDWTGPLVFTPDREGRRYQSPSGAQLTFANELAVHTKLDGAKDVFDADGRLVERELAAGNRFVLSYDSGDRLTKIEGPNGSSLRFTLNDEGRVVQIRASSGAAVRYGYQGDKLSEVRPDRGAAVRYTYNAGGLLDRIEHPQFGRVLFQYDGQGRVLTRRWMDGTEEEWIYDDQARTVRHVDPTGAVTSVRTSPDYRKEEMTDALGHKTELQFNDAGQIQRATGPTGRTVTNTYDDQGRVTQVEVPDVGSLRFEYRGASRQPASLTDVSGKQMSFDRDAKGKVVGVREGERQRMSVEYGPGGTLDKMKTCDGSDVSFTYDDEGRLKTVSHAPGAVTEFEYDDAGNLVREKNALGAVTTRTYDAAGRVTSLRTPDGATTHYRYSPGGLLKEIIDPSGAQTRYRYGGRVIEVTDPVGRTAVYAHDAAGRLESVTDAKGNRSRFEYDAAGNLIRSINPAGGVTTRSYDALGRLVEETDPAGGTTRYEYSETGRLTRAVGPGGETSHYEYDGKGQLARISDDAGRETRYEYDEAGRVVKIVDSQEGETGYEYTGCGHLTKIAPPDGPATDLAYYESGNVAELRRGDYVISYEYDPQDQPVKEKHNSGLEVSYRYDALGHLLGRQDNLGTDRAMRYDPLGRLLEIRDSTGAVTRFRYDLAGNLLSTTDPLEHAKRFRYTQAGELAQVVEPNGDTAEYEYDEAGNLTTIQHPAGGETKYVYDGRGNVQQATDPIGNTRRSTYDAVGRLTSTTDPNGRKTTYAYDASGRLIQKRLDDGKVVAYTYDEHGNLTEVDDSVFPVRYSYDALGNQTRIEYPTIQKTLEYKYDKRGRLVEFTGPEGRAVAYEYDALDRLTSIKTSEGGAISFVYDPKDRLTSLTYPNGVTGTWQYDGEDRVEQVSYADSAGKVVSRRQYKYDAAGNPVEVTDSEGRTDRYEYDAAGQLVSETAGDGKTIKYTYSPGGNRATRESGGKTIAYRYDEADRLLQAGEETFKYDGNGNLIERKSPEGTTRYTYDAEDRLVKVALPDGKEVAFGYAPTGERIWRQDTDGKTYFVTDGTNLLAELDGQLKPKATYLHGPGIDQPLMMRAGGRSSYYHADARNNVASLTDEDGGVAVSYRHDAFGNLLERQGRLDNPFTYAGREFDASTGFYYFRARYYCPEFGCFLAVDPLPFRADTPLTLNGYVYAGNNPMRFADPLGLDWLDAREVRISRLYDEYRSLTSPESRAATEAFAGSLRSPPANARGLSLASPEAANNYIRGAQNRIAEIQSELGRLGVPASELRAGGTAGVTGTSARVTGSSARVTGSAPGVTNRQPRVTGSMRPVLGEILKKRSTFPGPRFSSFATQDEIWGTAAVNPARSVATGFVAASAFLADCCSRQKKSSKQCVGELFASHLVFEGGRQGGALAVEKAAAWLAPTAGEGFAAGTGELFVASAEAGLLGGAAAYGTYKTGEASYEWGRKKSAQNEADSRERIARHAGNLLGELAIDELLPALKGELASIRTSNLRGDLMGEIKSDLANANEAEQLAKSELAGLEGDVSSYTQQLGETKLWADPARESLGTIATGAEKDADKVVTQLDEADAQAKNVSSSEERQKILDAYSTAAAVVRAIGGAAEDVQERNGKLKTWTKYFEQQRDSLPARQTLITAQKHFIVNQMVPAIEKTGRQLIAMNDALAKRKGALASRINNLRNALPTYAQTGRWAEAHIQLGQLQRDVEGIKIYDYTSHVNARTEEAKVLGMKVENYEGQVNPLLAQAEAGQFLAADDAVNRAHAAYKRAAERWARSEALRSQVAAWTPTDQPSTADAGDGMDVGSGLTDPDRPGGADPFGQGFGDPEQPEMPGGSDPFGQGFGDPEQPDMPGGGGAPFGQGGADPFGQGFGDPERPDGPAGSGEDSGQTGGQTRPDTPGESGGGGQTGTRPGGGTVPPAEVDDRFKPEDLEGTYALFEIDPKTKQMTRSQTFETLFWKVKGENDATATLVISSFFPDSTLEMGNVNRNVLISASRHQDRSGQDYYTAGGSQLTSTVEHIGRLLARSMPGIGYGPKPGKAPAVSISVNKAAASIVPAGADLSITLTIDVTFGVDGKENRFRNDFNVFAKRIASPPGRSGPPARGRPPRR